MDIIPYKGRYPDSAIALGKLGLLAKNPRQIQRPDLLNDEGIDVEYEFKGITPAVLKHHEVQELILRLAYEEARRYKEAKWKFARLDVKVGLKGQRKADIRSFPAAKHPDPHIMTYGPGYDVPQKYFLVDKLDQIIDIPLGVSPKIDPKRPYRVVKLVIGLRTPYPYVRPVPPSIEEATEKMRILEEYQKEKRKKEKEPPTISPQ